MDDTVAIALFRHGLTEDNKRHAYLGWTDSPLCLAEKEKMIRISENYDLLFSSDLGRCLETSKILFPDYTPEMISEIREMHFGKWEGKTYGELKLDPDYQKWLEDPYSAKPPEGESFADFSQRVEKGWEQAVNRMGEQNVKRAAIMTHGGVIRFLLSQYAPQKKDFWEWNIPHGKGYELIWRHGGQRRGERCISLRAVPLTANPDGSRNTIS